MWPIRFIVWALGPASIPVHAFSANGSSSSIPAIKDDCRRSDDLQLDFPKAVIRGVKKMSEDEGEKFFFDYWDFEGADEVGLTATNETYSPQSYDNHEAPEIQPRVYPFRPSVPTNMGFSPLFRRDFKCPTGTFACMAIDRPNSCCGAGDTCVLVQDTGLGDVGCCPQGQTCSGVIGSCQQGYMSCPASMGGGCCIPGYECVSGGCKFQVVDSEARLDLPASPPPPPPRAARQAQSVQPGSMRVLLIMNEAAAAQDETVTLLPALRRHRRPSRRTVVPSWCQPRRLLRPAERDDAPVAGLAVQTLWVEDAVQLGMHVVPAVPL
ncbi:putative GPI anchored protein [Aspergillus fischeri NRRL 181]|uniref:GPI anchored protein, putative n=1 Tax=Neosartorya fischeri (strain ATCC 1020 / DSM 3700 / CBS 544.65 / FGSC A1164 / JCM 1740 / NRRL 181 / WB 181) TaxID=331117 RepID=A1D3B0_NEOFI|nr:GPI anchored protein, putative [Aspergillus fischeri NRRL 181]EAW22903.1 GPI anchored protein, putative [Aspergillus fischeri NRRL 181]